MENFVVKKQLTIPELQAMAAETFGDMVKAVADISTGAVAFSNSMHSDAEKLLLEQGSAQENLWGFNIYPDNPEESMLEFQSLINIRPRQNNRTLEIQDTAVQEKVKSIVKKIIT